MQSMISVLAVALGGALGSVLRYLLNNAITAWLKTPFPFGIMAINILGGLVMGMLIAYFADVSSPSQPMRAFLTIGILGGFTTFSTFSADTVLLWQRGEPTQAILYAGGSVILSIGALIAGMLMVRGLSV